MQKLALTAIIIALFIVSKAQQQNHSSESNPAPPPPAIMMKNDKASGYNEDKLISSLAAEYKSAQNVSSNQYENEILKDFNSWWTYTYQNINLSQDFIGLAPDGKALSKKVFLQLLTTGEFYPAKTDLRDNLPCYRLYSLKTADKDIQNTIIQLASEQLSYYNMEGKELPAYQFEDIAGHKYNNVNTKGKIIVLKCWFIRCVACVKEFPELNKLVDSYKNRKDILFLSLAFDDKQDLITFLKTHKFSYAVAPNQQEFMNDKLGITTYPTHIIIAKDGKIVKAVDNYNDLVPAIKKETSKE